LLVKIRQLDSYPCFRLASSNRSQIRLRLLHRSRTRSIAASEPPAISSAFARRLNTAGLSSLTPGAILADHAFSASNRPPDGSIRHAPDRASPPDTRRARNRAAEPIPVANT
jgi:hypothetical protein